MMKQQRLSDTYRRRGKKVLVVRSDFLGDGYLRLCSFYLNQKEHQNHPEHINRKFGYR
ncbi:hypothetical protein LQQ63_26425 (plasmid) [Escherichia coli]|nr:hypothetical protein LQQ63_26425 [Escherichia coli]